MNRLVLLPVDPYLLYAYWDLPAGTPAATGGRPILRLHESAPGSQDSRPSDIDVDLTTGHASIHLWAPDRRYHAELGLRNADGTLSVLARSEAVTTPMGCPPPQPAVPMELDPAPQPEPQPSLNSDESDPDPYTDAPFTPGLSSLSGGPHVA